MCMSTTGKMGLPAFCLVNSLSLCKYLYFVCVCVCVCMYEWVGAWGAWGLCGCIAWLKMISELLMDRIVKYFFIFLLRTPKACCK